MRGRSLILWWCVSLGWAAEPAPATVPVPDVRETEPVNLILPIRNPYDRAMRVERVESNCTCTRLELAQYFLLPNASTVLHVAADNRNLSGEQNVGISVYLTDPDVEPIETTARWHVHAIIQVDAIGPGMDPLVRPTDRAWQDVYRYVSKERPDELNRLKKRIRLSCPPNEVPAEGLRVSGIDYPGTLWKFSPTTQPDGSILVTATARDVNPPPADGIYDEALTIRTNHPDKSRISLRFITIIDRKSGETPFDPWSPSGR